MEHTQKSRKKNRTTDERRDAINLKLAFHHGQILRLNKALEELDKPRKERQKRDSFARLAVDLKSAGKTPEEIRALLGL